jgi:hypothetical protein
MVFFNDGRRRFTRGVSSIVE